MIHKMTPNINRHWLKTRMIAYINMYKAQIVLINPEYQLDIYL